MKMLWALVFFGAFHTWANHGFASSVIYSQNFDNLPGGPSQSQPYVDAKNVLPVGSNNGQWQFWSITRTTSSPTSQVVDPPQGLIQVTSSSTNGSAVLILHDSSNGNYSLNEAILTLDLSQYTDVTLRFNEYDSDDEEHFFGTSQFSGHKQADGVAVSSNGANWFTLWQSPNHNGSWISSGLLNISSLIASVNNPALLSASSQFQIKFQQYDNYYHGTDGRKFDNIVVAGVLSPSGGAVPEPATMAMFSMGLLSLALTRKSMRRGAVLRSSVAGIGSGVIAD